MLPLFLSLSAARAHADLVMSPVSVVNNTLGSFSADYAPEYLIDQSGLSDSFTSGVTNFDSYISSNPRANTTGNQNHFFSSSGNTTGQMDFDLGDTFSIERLALWNIGGSTISNLNSFTVFTSETLDFSSATNAGTFSAHNTTSRAIVPVQVFDLTDSEARYVRMQINSNHGHANFTGFAELAFDVSAATTSIPEPSSATMLFGFVSCLTFRRRRRST